VQPDDFLKAAMNRIQDNSQPGAARHTPSAKPTVGKAHNSGKPKPATGNNKTPAHIPIPVKKPDPPHARKNPVQSATPTVQPLKAPDPKDGTSKLMLSKWALPTTPPDDAESPGPGISSSKTISAVAAPLNGQPRALTSQTTSPTTVVQGGPSIAQNQDVRHATRNEIYRQQISNPQTVLETVKEFEAVIKANGKEPNASASAPSIEANAKAKSPSLDSSALQNQGICHGMTQNLVYSRAWLLGFSHHCRVPTGVDIRPEMFRKAQPLHANSLSNCASPSSLRAEAGSKPVSPVSPDGFDKLSIAGNGPSENGSSSTRSDSLLSDGIADPKRMLDKPGTKTSYVESLASTATNAVTKSGLTDLFSSKYAN
jgi:hypothetical protein